MDVQFYYNESLRQTEEEADNHAGASFYGRARADQQLLESAQLAEERRQGAADMPTKLAVYGRPDQNVSGGHCIYPVQWNVTTKMWEIQPHVVRKSIIVTNGEFVLLESKDGRSKDGTKFDTMLDKFDTTASAGEV